MRVLIDGLPYTGRRSLAWGLVSALQFRRLPAEHHSGPLANNPIAAWAWRQSGRRPKSKLPLWMAPMLAAADRLASHDPETITIQEGYWADPIARAAVYKLRGPGLAVRAAERIGPRFDIVVLLRSPRGPLLERMRQDHSPDPFASATVGKSKRFRRADDALREWAVRQDAMILRTERVNADAIREKVLSRLLSAWSTRSGWLEGGAALPTGAPELQPYESTFSSEAERTQY